MLKQELIEKALALTGRTIDDVEETLYNPIDAFDSKFSMEKFCYYLCSPEFIEKYTSKENESIRQGYWHNIWFNIERFGRAIYEYQKGNEETLENLLNKI